MERDFVLHKFICIATELFFLVEDFGIKIFYFVIEVMICYILTADQSQPGLVPADQ